MGSLSVRSTYVREVVMRNGMYQTNHSEGRNANIYFTSVEENLWMNLEKHQKRSQDLFICQTWWRRCTAVGGNGLVFDDAMEM